MVLYSDEKWFWVDLSLLRITPGRCACATDDVTWSGSAGEATNMAAATQPRFHFRSLSTAVSVPLSNSLASEVKPWPSSSMAGHRHWGKNFRLSVAETWTRGDWVRAGRAFLLPYLPVFPVKQLYTQTLSLQIPTPAKAWAVIFRRKNVWAWYHLSLSSSTSLFLCFFFAFARWLDSL